MSQRNLFLLLLCTAFVAGCSKGEVGGCLGVGVLVFAILVGIGEGQKNGPGSGIGAFVGVLVVGLGISAGITSCVTTDKESPSKEVAKARDTGSERSGDWNWNWGNVPRSAEPLQLQEYRKRLAESQQQQKKLKSGLAELEEERPRRYENLVREGIIDENGKPKAPESPVWKHLATELKAIVAQIELVRRKLASVEQEISLVEIMVRSLERLEKLKAMGVSEQELSSQLKRIRETEEQIRQTAPTTGPAGDVDLEAVLREEAKKRKSAK